MRWLTFIFWIFRHDLAGKWAWPRERQRVSGRKPNQKFGSPGEPIESTIISKWCFQIFKARISESLPPSSNSSVCKFIITQGYCEKFTWVSWSLKTLPWLLSNISTIPSQFTLHFILTSYAVVITLITDHRDRCGKDNKRFFFSTSQKKHRFRRFFVEL